MTSYVVTVMVADKKTGKGLSGHKVKLYGSDAVKTDKSGKVTLISESSEIDVYVDGFKVYSGYASKAPRPIVVFK